MINADLSFRLVDEPNGVCHTPIIRILFLFSQLLAQKVFKDGDPLMKRMGGSELLFQLPDILTKKVSQGNGSVLKFFYRDIQERSQPMGIEIDRKQGYVAADVDVEIVFELTGQDDVPGKGFAVIGRSWLVTQVTG